MPVAIGFGNVAPPSVEYARSIADTPAASAADHVTAVVRPPTSTSVPEPGASRATLGSVLSMTTDTGAGPIANCGVLLHARSFTELTVIVPVPLAYVLLTAMLNSCPESPAGPHAVPTMTSSTV